MSHHSAWKLLSSPLVPNCHFGKLKCFRTATLPCCMHMDIVAVTHGVVNMWVWLKSLQLCCRASATPTFCATRSFEALKLVRLLLDLPDLFLRSLITLSFSSNIPGYMSSTFHYFPLQVVGLTVMPTLVLAVDLFFWMMFIVPQVPASY